MPPQIAAIRAGLLCVVPQPVLDLLTWQQMEKRICGDPEITVAELQKFSMSQGQPRAAPCPPQGRGIPLIMLVLHMHPGHGVPERLGEDKPEGPWMLQV